VNEIQQDQGCNRLAGQLHTAVLTSLHLRRPHKHMLGKHLYKYRNEIRCVLFLKEFKIGLKWHRAAQLFRGPGTDSFNMKRQPYLKNIFPFSDKSSLIPLIATRPCKPARTARLGTLSTNINKPTEICHN
jgi:hypothetical protein